MEVIRGTLLRRAWAVLRSGSGASWAPWAALLISTLGGCFSPEFSAGECAVRCTDSCPEGLQCRDNFCVSPNFSGTCTTGGALGSGGESSASGGKATVSQGGASGGTTLVPEPTGGKQSAATGGVTGAAGAAPRDGGAGGEGPNPTLEVTASQVGSACTGRETIFQLAVRDGVEPYSFELGRNDCGFALATVAGAGTQLSGTRSTAGECEIEVIAHDAEQHFGQVMVTVVAHETPRLLTERLAAACPAEEYSTALTAEDGDEKNYSFHVQTPSGMNWELDGNIFSGLVTFNAAREVEAWVEDGYCESEHRKLSLPLEPPTSEACPRIETESKKDSLPNPCSGLAYQAPLKTTGVTSWEALEQPPGLELAADAEAPERLLLSGTPDWPPTEERALRLRIANAKGRSVLARYSLLARDKCWLGYTSRQDGPWKFHLFDPELGSPQAFPASADLGAVKTFAYSPDGEFVAYQTESADATIRLRLLNMRSFHDQALQFAGSVLYFAWSPDSSILAATLQTEAEIQLAGVDVTSVRGVSKNTLGSASYIEPSSFSGEGAFSWFAERSITYLIPGFPPPTYEIEYRALVDRKFAEGVSASVAPYTDTTKLIGSADGFWANDADHLDFYPSDPEKYPNNVFFTHASGAPSPSGRYVARAVASSLNLFRATSTTAFPKAAEPCGAVLAWSSNPERVACITNVEGGGEIRLFRPDAAGAALTSSVVPGNYKSLYLESNSEQRRRLFSPRGRYFAFTTDNGLYVSDLNSGRNFRTYSPWDAATAESAAHIALSFSSDERFLLQHRGDFLTVQELAQADQHRMLLAGEGTLRTPAVCSETYMGHVDSWCGGPASSPDFAWSPRGHLVAFRSASGALQVIEVLSAFDTGDRMMLNPDCTPDCLGSFAFQP